MLPFNPHTKDQLVVVPPLERQLEFLLLPPKRHLRKTNLGLKHLDFNHVVMSVLKTQRFTVIILVVVRVTPTVAVHQETPVADVLVIIELKLVLLNHPAEHHPQQHPRTHIEPSQLYKYLPLRLSDLSQAGPIHILVACLEDTIRHPEEMLARISPKYVL
jgi:hypothetical protein